MIRIPTKHQETSARTPLYQNARISRRAAAMPAGGHGAEHQEDRSAAGKFEPEYADFRLTDVLAGLSINCATTSRRKSITASKTETGN